MQTKQPALANRTGCSLMATHKLLLLPGDGIGPEVMREVEKIVGWFRAARHRLRDRDRLVGGAAYDAHKVAITDDAMKRAQEADAVLFGAVGGPKWDTVPYAMRPEAGVAAACARISACSPICARRSAIRRSPMPPR